MKRSLELDEMIEQWTLLPDELAWLSNKIRETRLGFAIGVKFFQQEHCFPAAANDVRPEVISHVAQEVEVDATEFENYDWGSRAARYHRQQIRELCGFRPDCLI